MSALNHVVERAVELHWLPETPFGNWKKLDKGPSKKVRLLSPEELDTFCAAAFVPQKEMDEQHWPPEYQAVIWKSNQAFSDYFYLLSYSGGREKETRRQRWSHVRWSKRTFFFPGSEAKKGAGKPAPDREVDFNPVLEAHLRAIYARRNPKCDWMFPNAEGTGPVKSFRKQLKRVRAVTGMTDVGFHFGRHYFISHAMMSQPHVDVKTIATWVGHRDGGVLILRVYGHLRPGHAAKMAAHGNLRPDPTSDAPPADVPA